MIKTINDDRVITTDEMEREYFGLTILYQIVRDGSLIYKGKVLAVADFDDAEKLSKMQLDYHNRNIETSMCFSDNSNQTLSVVGLEVV